MIIPFSAAGLRFVTPSRTVFSISPWIRRCSRNFARGPVCCCRRVHGHDRPVAPLHPFKTEREAIKMAQRHPTLTLPRRRGREGRGLAGDIGRIWRVAEALEYGIVGINEGIISTEIAPFGGMKESGIGREGSKYGIEDYLEVKYLCMGGIDR